MCRLLPLLLLAGVAFAAQLPDKFYGKYDLDHDENFDQYLEAKGYSWFTRKLVTFATFKKEFRRSAKPNSFDLDTLTSKKDVFFKDVALGQEFTAEYLDSTKHKVVFSLNGDRLSEKHEPTEGGEAKPETYVYYFDGDKLIQEMSVQNDGKTVTAKRYYKRI